MSDARTTPPAPARTRRTKIAAVSCRFGRACASSELALQGSEEANSTDGSYDAPLSVSAVFGMAGTFSISNGRKRGEAKRVGAFQKREVHFTRMRMFSGAPASEPVRSLSASRAVCFGFPCVSPLVPAGALDAI